MTELLKLFFKKDVPCYTVMGREIYVHETHVVCTDFVEGRVPVYIPKQVLATLAAVYHEEYEDEREEDTPVP